MYYIEEFDFYIDDNSDKNIRTLKHCFDISKDGFFNIDRTGINTIVEIGANVGYYTKHLGLYYNDANIFSFEPFYGTYSILMENTKKLSNVNVYNIALYDKSGCVKLKFGNTSRGHEVDTNSGHIPVKTKTFSDIIQMLPTNSIDLLILDCVGGERYVDIDLIYSLNVKYLYIYIDKSNDDIYSALFSNIIWELNGDGYTIKVGELKYE